MKISRNLKSIIFFAIIALLISSANVFKSNDPILNLIALFQKRSEVVLKEKIYVHTDKNVYFEGEYIWFKIYLVDQSSLLPNDLSKTVYVSLIGASGQELIKKKIFIEEGVGTGEFEIAKSVPAGHYHIRAFTNYMLNFEEDPGFTKKIAIISENSNETRPSLSEKKGVDFQWFPEGGHLLNGVQNKLAFKAIDFNAYPVKVKGVIKDTLNNELGFFESQHDGMGVIDFTGDSKNRYFAELTSETGEIWQVKLPEIDPFGYQVNINKDEFFVTASIIRKNDQSDSEEEMSLIVQSSGKICFAVKGVISDKSIVRIPVDSLPPGVNQVTLFNGKGKPVSERLVFMTKPNRNDLSILTDKKEYSFRDEVRLNINLNHNELKSSSGNFSMSVYEILDIPFIETHPISIESYLLLTSELRGYIHNPSYYFTTNNPEVIEHADLLMLTNGWRRYNWNEIIENKTVEINYINEQGIPVSGRIFNSSKKRPIKSAKLNLMTDDGDFVMLEMNKEAGFYTDDLVVFDSAVLLYKTFNMNDKEWNYFVSFDEITHDLPEIKTLDNENFENFSTSYADKIKKIQLMKLMFDFSNDAELLDEVEITGKKTEEEDKVTVPFKIYSKADETVLIGDYQHYFKDLFQLLEGRVSGLRVTRPSNNQSAVWNIEPEIWIRGTRTTMFLLDGMPVSEAVLMEINPQDVHHIDILKGTNAAIFGSRGAGGAIAVYTQKSGIKPLPADERGMELFSLIGFATPKEFYKPKYYNNSEDSFLDLRLTLEWNPSVVIDESGKFSTTFFTGDTKANYLVVVEGITNNGIPIVDHSTFTTE